MQKRIVQLFIFALCISCNSGEKKIASLWLFNSYTGPIDKEVNHITNASFLMLAEDATYTRDFPRFESGKWTYLRDSLILSTEEGISGKYRVTVNGKELHIEIERNVFVTFKSFPVKAEAENENPFCAINNQWRVKARQKETDEQIKGRVLNHLRYWECYFTWAYNNKLATIDVRSTATPIKIYGNGFTIKPQSELPRAWTRLFYDEQDALRANQFLVSLVRKHRIKWSETENKYIMFSDAFRQLQENLRKL